jgi:hypothetical protein
LDEPIEGALKALGLVEVLNVGHGPQVLQVALFAKESPRFVPQLPLPHEALLAGGTAANPAPGFLRVHGFEAAGAKGGGLILLAMSAAVEDPEQGLWPAWAFPLLALLEGEQLVELLLGVGLRLEGLDGGGDVPVRKGGQTPLVLAHRL